MDVKIIHSSSTSNLVFYPFYGIIYERENHIRTEVIDGITGIRQPKIERLVTIESEKKI